MPAVSCHAYEIDKNLRDQDRAEVEALGLVPLRVLQQSVSRDTKTALIGGVPAAMFGVSPAPKRIDVAAIWMLGTNELLKHPVSVLRYSREFVGESRKKYPCLMNYVDCRNTVSIKWLKWLGAKFYPPVPYGLLGKPFMPFYFGSDPFVR